MPPDTGSSAVPAAPAGPQVRSAKLLGNGFAVALGLARPSARPPEPATALAIERSFLAADRTLMAWVRTTLSMISFGFTLGKLGQTVQAIEVSGLFRGPRMVGVQGLAYFLVALGTIALLAAAVQYLVSLGEYSEMGLRRRVSISFVVAMVLVVIGGLALTALVLQL